MRGLLLLGMMIGSMAAAATNAVQQQASEPKTAVRPAPDPIADPSQPIDGEIVVTGSMPITRGGAWVFRRSDIVLLRGSGTPLRLVPAASWAACMPTAQTDAMVRWLALTGPYLTARETEIAVARLAQDNVAGEDADNNDLMAILPSNLACYPPRRSTVEGGKVDVLQFCRQRKVAMGKPRRSFQMRLIGRHSNTEISMRYTIDESTNTAGVGISDPSEESTIGGLDRPTAPVAGEGLRLRMANEATWRTECRGNARRPLPRNPSLRGDAR